MQHSVTDLDRVREAYRGVDNAIHLAARPSVPWLVKDPLETNRINVNGTLNVPVAALRRSESAYSDIHCPEFSCGVP
jgi:UDP-glucose 4-epimerase